MVNLVTKKANTSNKNSNINIVKLHSNNIEITISMSDDKKKLKSYIKRLMRY